MLIRQRQAQVPGRPRQSARQGVSQVLLNVRPGMHFWEFIQIRCPDDRGSLTNRFGTSFLCGSDKNLTMSFRASRSRFSWTISHRFGSFGTFFRPSLFPKQNVREREKCPKMVRDGRKHGKKPSIGLFMAHYKVPWHVL